VAKNHRFLLISLALVAIGALAAWAGQSWRSSSGDLASVTVTETVPAITLAAVPARVPSQRAPMPGSTLTPTLYVLSAEPTIQPTATITPTPAPTVDYGVPGATGRVEIPAIRLRSGIPLSGLPGTTWALRPSAGPETRC
jgi:hypothetical protein